MSLKVIESIACKLVGHTICPYCKRCANCSAARGVETGKHHWIDETAFRCNEKWQREHKQGTWDYDLWGWVNVIEGN